MKALEKIWNFITTVLIILVALLAIALVGVRLVKLTPYPVLSASMEPTYRIGSLIYVKDVEPADIDVGMPITYVVNEDLLVATYRVAAVERFDTRMQEITNEAGQPILDEDGNQTYEEVPLDEPSYYYTTKGDTDDVENESPVYYKNVLGTPVLTIPYLGYLSSWLQSEKGMILSGCIAVVLLMLSFVPKMIRKKETDGST